MADWLVGLGWWWWYKRMSCRCVDTRTQSSSRSSPWTPLRSNAHERYRGAYYAPFAYRRPPTPPCRPVGSLHGDFSGRRRAVALYPRVGEAFRETLTNPSTSHPQHAGQRSAPQMCSRRSVGAGRGSVTAEYRAGALVKCRHTCGARGGRPPSIRLPVDQSNDAYARLPRAADGVAGAGSGHTGRMIHSPDSTVCVERRLGRSPASTPSYLS